MSDKYCPTCDPVLKSMSRVIEAREHDCRVMESMVKGRDAEIERLQDVAQEQKHAADAYALEATELRRELDDAKVEIEQLTQANDDLNRAVLEMFK
jgi:hypothetical protein